LKGKKNPVSPNLFRLPRACGVVRTVFYKNVLCQGTKHGGSNYKRKRPC
jgi:hypothetical protein